jgi:hypothetical protein
MRGLILSIVGAFVFAGTLCARTEGTNDAYASGKGDAGPFILGALIDFGAHLSSTNDLPKLTNGWSYHKSDIGVGVNLTAVQSNAVDAFFLKTLGKPTSEGKFWEPLLKLYNRPNPDPQSFDRVTKIYSSLQYGADVWFSHYPTSTDLYISPKPIELMNRIRARGDRKSSQQGVRDGEPRMAEPTNSVIH